MKKRANPNRLRINAYEPIVSAFLVAILGLSPALSLLHVAFSSHHRHYCSLHGRLEEVDLKETASERFSNDSVNSADRDDLAVRNSSELAPRHHVACALLNDGSPRIRPTLNDCRSTIIDRENERLLRDALKPMVSRCQLFLLAPKHSPPVIVHAFV